MEGYQIKPGKIGAKVIGAYGNIEKKFTDAFLEADESSESGYRLKTGKAGDAAVDAYKKIEQGVTGAYQSVEDAFVETFLEKKEESK